MPTKKSTKSTDLKMKTVTVHEVDYNDLGDFISFTYGVEFDVVSDQEMGNDSDKVFAVKKGNISEYDLETFESAKTNGYFDPYSLNTILTDLCNRDLIPAGRYVVRVCW